MSEFGNDHLGELADLVGVTPIPRLRPGHRTRREASRIRLEATADLRNLLAQGYLTLNTVGGQQLILVENPRSVRGGLSYREAHLGMEMIGDGGRMTSMDVVEVNPLAPPGI